MSRRFDPCTAVVVATVAFAALLFAATPSAFGVPPGGFAGAGQPHGSAALAVGGTAPSGQQGLGAGAPGKRGLLGSGAALVALAAAGAAALIVQNKGGGHGELGYHLALNLAKEKGLKVTIITDSAAKKNKPPFDSYGDLEAAGVEVRWADLAKGELAAAMDGIAPCQYVFDNQNVCTQDVQKTVAAWKPKAYAYVSSGGMYKPKGSGPLVETGDVKEDNEQLGNEKNAAGLGLNWSAFRPQYIYGPKTNKRDYIDWFLDRITRDLPIPLPGDGSFTTTLTNAADVAGMLASVVGKEDAAKCQVFNCATDVRVSHNEVVAMVASALGKDPAVVMNTVKYYDPASLKGKDLPKGGKFPFREAHFGVGVDKAKSVLGWAPKCKIEEDLAWYIAEYKRLGKDKGDVVRDWDVAVINACTSPA